MNEIIVEDVAGVLGQWVADVLIRARQNLEQDGCLNPVILGRSDEGLVMVPLTADQMNDPDAVLAVSAMVKLRPGVTEVVRLRDTYVHRAQDEEARRALDDDVSAWRSWSADYKRRVGYQQREAIDLFVERKGLPPGYVMQFYRRASDGNIVFEECLCRLDGDGPQAPPPGFRRHPSGGLTAAGDLASMLTGHSGGGPVPEDAWRLAEDVFSMLRIIGYAVVFEASGMTVRRPDGSPFLVLEEATAGDNWPRWCALVKRVFQSEA